MKDGQFNSHDWSIVAAVRLYWLCSELRYKTHGGLASRMLGTDLDEPDPAPSGMFILTTNYTTPYTSFG